MEKEFSLLVSFAEKISVMQNMMLGVRHLCVEKFRFTPKRKSVLCVRVGGVIPFSKEGEG